MITPMLLLMWLGALVFGSLLGWFIVGPLIIALSDVIRGRW